MRLTLFCGVNRKLLAMRWKDAISYIIKYFEKIGPVMSFGCGKTERRLEKQIDRETSTCDMSSRMF